MNANKLICSFVRQSSSVRLLCTGAQAVPPYSSAATPTPSGQPVGPGADKKGDYKNTEYYSYNNMSYFDLEEEMVKDRIPQPSADNGQL